MFSSLPHQLLADLVLTLHFGIVVFVVGLPPMVLVGNQRRWRWVNALGVRLAHLLAIGVVVLQSWLGAVCPLTQLEMWLRAQAQQSVYAGSFVEYWLRHLLYYDAPVWVFTLVYTLFGLVVVALWWRYPPQRHGR